MFNFSINLKMRDIRTTVWGDHKDPRNRTSEFGNGKSRKLSILNPKSQFSKYSKNKPFPNKISIFTSKLPKIWGTKKNILRSSSVSHLFFERTFQKLNGRYMGGEKFELSSEL